MSTIFNTNVDTNHTHKEAERQSASEQQNVQQALQVLNPDLSYNDWFRTAAYLKRHGFSYDLFATWSARSDRFDNAEAEDLWSHCAADGAETVGKGSFIQILENNPAGVTAAPEAMLPLPGTDEARQEQTEKFLQLFEDTDFIQVITSTNVNTHGKIFPSRPGEILSPREHERIAAGLHLISKGAYCSLNPIRQNIQGKAPSDADITAYRYTLIEADELSREEQWAQVRALHIPVAMAIWSGGKSIHLIVRINADDKETYAKRVKFLHEYLNGKRYPADRATKNASRLTRIPGCKRGNDQQYIVADGFGFPTWDAFESWVTAIKKLKDQRSQTSVQNGQRGGRPPMLAQDFASTIADRWRDSDGNLLVLFYKTMKQWYKFNPMQGWMEQNNIQDWVMQEMQALPLSEKTRISRELCKDIAFNLQARRNCGIVNDGIVVDPPFWLSGNRIEPKDGYFTVFPNGILNVTAAIAGAEEPLHSMTPKFFGKRDVDFEYDPAAQCSRWLKYLEEVQPEEENRIALQQLAGHVISGRKTNAVFIILGEGGTGKSVFAHILRELIGKANSCAIQLSEMGDRFNAIELTKKRLNLVEELPVMSKKDMADAERLLKMCSDGNTIRVEQKYKPVTSAPATAVNVFVTNALPFFCDHTDGLWRRLHLIQFSEVMVGRNTENTNLREELEQELPGIYNWALHGAAMLDPGKPFVSSDAGAQILQAHRIQCDPVPALIKKLFVGGCNKMVSRNRAYEKFKQSCLPLKRNPPSKDVFAKELQKAFPDIIPCVEHNKYYTEEVWKGIDFRYGSHTDPVDAIENRGDVPDDNDGCDHQTADVDAVVRPVKTTAIPSRTAEAIVDMDLPTLGF